MSQLHIDADLEWCLKQQVIGRLWQRDAGLWVDQRGEEDSVRRRLGWLELPTQFVQQLPEVESVIDQARQDGLSHMLLIGMGGSSLASLVLSDFFSSSSNPRSLTVLDNTHPLHVKALIKQLDLSKTLVVVASKSGTTLETRVLFDIFWQELGKVSDRPQEQVIAITDPGTPLEQIGGEQEFRYVFLAPPDVGGRYSVFSVFGMVPAVFLGIDVRTLLDRAIQEMQLCQRDVRDNLALQLGSFLGRQAKRGRHIALVMSDPKLSSLTLWIEQLLAESTGKHGRGLLPVAWSFDQVLEPQNNFSGLLITHEASEFTAPQGWEQVPFRTVHLRDVYDLGAVFYRFEIATTVAAAMLKVNPFDQPDVELTKIKTHNLIEGSGPVVWPDPAFTNEKLQAWSSGHETAGHVEEVLRDLMAEESAFDAVVIMAYLPESVAWFQAMQRLQQRLCKYSGKAVAINWAPRCLHSTGQWHKGGANRAVYIQLSVDHKKDIKIPEQPVRLSKINHAQALGDFQALIDQGRKGGIATHVTGRACDPR